MYKKYLALTVQKGNPTCRFRLSLFFPLPKEFCKNFYHFFSSEPWEEKTGELVLQYYETDWEFLKRIASRRHQFLVPDPQTMGIKLSYALRSRIVSRILSCMHPLLSFTQNISIFFLLFPLKIHLKFFHQLPPSFQYFFCTGLFRLKYSFL